MTAQGGTGERVILDSAGRVIGVEANPAQKPPSTPVTGGSPATERTMRVQSPMEQMLARLDGLPVTRAESMPPGSICGLCALQRHTFVHPHSIPGSLWSLVDGCPCCETHVAATSDDPWGVPPLGTEKVDA